MSGSEVRVIMGLGGVVGTLAATSAYGLANILSTMTTYADLSAWTKAE